MKYKYQYILSVSLVLVLLPSCIWAKAPQPQLPPPKLYLDGREIGQDTPPVIVNGRTLVPLRLISEELGFSVEWHEEEQTVLVQAYDGLILSFTIGDTSFGIGDMEGHIDTPPMIIGDRTYLPVRAIADAYHLPLTWDSKTRSVIFGEGHVEDTDEISRPDIETIAPTPAPAPRATPKHTPKKQTFPVGHGRIKGNRKSKVYHLPGSNHYNKVSPQNTVYFETEAQAKQAGYRPSKSRN